MNCSDFITEHLTAAGIQRFFGYLGDPSVELLETARRNSRTNRCSWRAIIDPAQYATHF